MPGIYWLRMPLPFALDHINVWLIEDGEGWTLVDTGMATPETREVWQRLMTDGMLKRPITRIIVTHCHPDHLGQAAWLAQTFDVPVDITQGELEEAQRPHAMSEADADRVAQAFYRTNGATGQLHAHLVERCASFRAHRCALPERTRELRHGQTMQIGENTWDVLVGRGHSPDHAMLHCAALGVLISGDMVLPAISPNLSVTMHTPDANPIQDYIDALDGLTDLPADTLVLPAHGEAFRGLPERRQVLREKLDERNLRLLNACDAPLTAVDAMPILFARKLEGDDLVLALGEAASHLQYLFYRGWVERRCSAQGVVQYVRKTEDATSAIADNSQAATSGHTV
ncbi:MBL fold metallo-hydrolase [Pandoraea pneumonica]|uniref:MBL fold metallo-hydrolase n=1 Tax=Pandoraea pneumonica TaxID=2508299 RepID=UPI003CF4F72B